jgi:hypothetical protein
MAATFPRAVKAMTWGKMTKDEWRVTWDEGRVTDDK